MPPGLLPAWLGDGDALPIRDEASVSLAREWVRREAAAIAMPQVPAEAAAIIMSELAHNQLAHARGGHVRVRAIQGVGPGGAVPGLEIVAADAGRGIADPTAALQGGQSSAGTLGIGLPGVRRLSDELDLDVRWEEGTCVFARKYAEPVPRRAEVAILGRPCVGERRSGDDGLFCRVAGGLLLALADGLGHGEPARAASERVMAALRQRAAAGQGAAVGQGAAAGQGAAVLPTPSALLDDCDDAVQGTRGAVAAVALLREDGLLSHACVGNVSTHIDRGEAAQHLPCLPGTLGGGRRGRSALGASAQLARGDVLVLFTDGLSGRLSLRDLPLLRRQHPLAIAHALLQRFGREHDDALLLVAR